MKTNPKLFSIEEANRLIPMVSDLFEKVIRKKENYARQHDMVFMHELIAQAEGPGNEASQNELQQDIQGLEEAVADLEQDVKKINDLGCIVRNIESGWVDFLGERNGQKIYLCWKRGDKAVRYYRLPNSGAKDIRPLD